MVDNVLECARIQAGSETLNLELVDLNDLVGMVESAMAPVAAKKGVAFTTRVDFDVPLIMGDWEKLRRVLANLTSNAVKFTDAGREVAVRVCCEADEDDARKVVMRVTDTGIGHSERGPGAYLRAVPSGEHVHGAPLRAAADWALVGEGSGGHDGRHRGCGK